MKRLCPQCQAKGLRSQIWSSQPMRISPGYWDEEGDWHEPINPNTRTRFWCSNAHSWTEEKGSDR